MTSKKLLSAFGGITLICALAFASSQAVATSSQPTPLAGCEEQPSCTYGGHGVRLCCDPL
ncbi:MULTISPECIES: hypothetical protein [Stenotrophomonas]|jgi:hypothetical protein|uniref:hypothetical protein n=1 Tax=Stenotrophomonas TaxID=40323 RepID=UPI003208F5D0